MAKVFDRVLETSTTEGTGSFTLAGAKTGFRAFADACTSGDVVPYCIEGDGAWEVGLGTFTAPATLARTTIKASSNSGLAVNFAVGTKNVFIDWTAAMADRVKTADGTAPVISNSAALAAGPGVTASASNAVAIGNGSSCSATNGVVIGNGSTAQGASTCAIGNDVQVTSSDYAVAIGHNTDVASSPNSIAIGADVSASAGNCIAVGQSRQGAEYSVSLGVKAADAGLGDGGGGNTASYSTALGAGAYCDVSFGVAVGYAANARASGGVAIGARAAVPVWNGSHIASGGVAIGSDTEVHYDSSAAIGSGVRGTLGRGCFTTGAYSNATHRIWLYQSTDTGTTTKDFNTGGNGTSGESMHVGADRTWYTSTPRKVLGYFEGYVYACSSGERKVWKVSGLYESDATGIVTLLETPTITVLHATAGVSALAVTVSVTGSADGKLKMGADQGAFSGTVTWRARIVLDEAMVPD